MSILRKFNEFKEAPSYGMEPETNPDMANTDTDKDWVDEGKRLAEMMDVDPGIMFASETSTFLVNGKDTGIKTAEEMKEFLESGKSVETQVQESKRYRKYGR